MVNISNGVECKSGVDYTYGVYLNSQEGQIRMEKSILVLAIGMILFGACAAPSTPPAGIEVVSLNIVPPEVAAGETASITAEVRNTGASQATYTAKLIVSGVNVETKDIIVGAGATETITFTLVKDTPGTYKIAIGGLSSSLVVKAKPVIKEIELKYDDGVAAKAIWAGPTGGHLIHFSPPSIPFTVKKVKICGLLRGTGWEGREFEIQIWDKDKKTLWKNSYPFAEFLKGAPVPWHEEVRWVELEIQNIEVTSDFYVHVYTDSPMFQGIGICFDDSIVNEHSEATSNYQVTSALPVSKETVNWMIRVVGMEIERQ